MMAWLRVTGMIPPEPGSYWSEGTLTVWPAYRERLDWSDGGRRAAWPITGTLAGAGTRWASTRDAGDVLIPGADVGVSVKPPVIELTVRLRDGVTGEWKTARLVGIAEATAPGEWNINAPLKNTLRHVETPGVPAGALRTTDVGVVVPSMAQHQSVEGRVGKLEHAYVIEEVWADNSHVRRWSSGLLEVWGGALLGTVPPSRWEILTWTLPATFVGPYIVQGVVTESGPSGNGGFFSPAVFETAASLAIGNSQASVRVRHNHSDPLYCWINYIAKGFWRLP